MYLTIVDLTFIPNTLFRFFKNYNYCEPEVVNLNTFDACEKFVMTDAESRVDFKFLGGTKD